MRRPLPSAVGTGLTVVVAMIAGCAGRPSTVALSDRLVRGADGTGGVEWPMAPESEVARETAPEASVTTATEVPTAPRPLEEVRDAATLETTDPRLKAVLEALAARPTLEARLEAADEYRRLGIFDRAHSLLNDALAEAPRNADVLDALARLWRDWGVPAQALPVAYRAVAASPRSPDVINTLATTLFALGHVAAAQERFGEVLRLDEGAAYAHSNLCYVALVQGDEVRALAECHAALAIDPAHQAARNNLALVHAMAGRWDAAAGEFQRAAGDTGIAEFNLGVALMARREYERAADVLERLADRRPDLGPARTRAREARRLAAVDVTAEGRK